MLAALGEVAFFGSVGQPPQFLLKPLQHDGDIVDCLLHLLVVALVSRGNQFVDLAVGNLRQDAVALADGQKDGVQHGVDAAHDLGKCALELLRLAAVGELSLLGGINQPRHLPLQPLQNLSHIIDGQLHLLVVALVVLRDQFVDLAA